MKKRLTLRDFLFTGFASVTFAVYFYGILHIPIWIDEAFTMQQARLSNFDILKQATFEFDAVHLGYYITSSFLLNIFSDSLVTLRLFSLTLTVFTCLNVYKIGMSFFGKKAAIFAAYAYAVLPSTYDYATQARSTSLVTFLVTLVLLTLIKEDSATSFKSIVKTNLFFGCHVILNITSILCVPIYLLLIRMLRPNVVVQQEFRQRFLIPLVAVFPLVVIAKSQDEQIDWIGSSFSPFREAIRIFLWPFIESEHRFLDSYWIYPAVLMLALLFSVTSCKFRVNRQRNIVYWLMFFFLFPSLALWILSLVHPILLTRYIAYSGIAFALLLGMSLSLVSSNSLKLGISFVILGFSLANGVSIFENRDHRFDWQSKYAVVKLNPDTPVLVASPDWYTPMLKYYAPSEYEVKSINQLMSVSKIVQVDRCDSLPPSVFLIAKSNKVEREDSERLRELGYERIRLEPKTLTAVEYYVLNDC